jgi:hypothetical protein
MFTRKIELTPKDRFESEPSGSIVVPPNGRNRRFPAVRVLYGEGRFPGMREGPAAQAERPLSLGDRTLADASSSDADAP